MLYRLSLAGCACSRRRMIEEDNHTHSKAVSVCGRLFQSKQAQQQYQLCRLHTPSCSLHRIPKRSLTFSCHLSYRPRALSCGEFAVFLKVRLEELFLSAPSRIALPFAPSLPPSLTSAHCHGMETLLVRHSAGRLYPRLSASREQFLPKDSDRSSIQNSRFLA